MYILERAKPEDFDVCMRILREGREFQREQGFIQWDNDYPTNELIAGDIQAQKGYVLKADREIAGYMYIDFDGEPAYDHIKGAWRSEEPYMVVHRMAYDKKFRGQGLTVVVFSMIDKMCTEQGFHSIRVDTHPDNKRMQHVFEKNGFVRCGLIYFQDGDKVAYDKIL